MKLFQYVTVLTLVLLFPLGPMAPRVHGVVQSGPSTWSPFGPTASRLIITDYSDFQQMFNAFTSGLVDLTDWPIQPTDISGFSGNPDFYVTNPTPDFGIFQLDINHHAPFLGVSGLTTRTLKSPSIFGTPVTSAGCTTGFGRLNIVLRNMEEGNSTVLDSLNKVTVITTGGNAITMGDVGGANPKGVYVLPRVGGCMLAGTYTVTSSGYNTGSSSVFVNTAQIVNVTISVNYNSPSTMKLTNAGVEISMALSHLLDKPNFVVGAPSVAGMADYDDIQVPAAQGMSIGGAGNSKLPQSVISQECTELATLDPTLPCTPVSAYNLVGDNIGAGSEWWSTFGVAAGASSGYSGTADLRAACDHFVAAGFTITPSTAKCSDVANAASGTAPPASYPHLVGSGHVILYARTHLPRQAFGTIIADTLNFLFGTPSSSGGGIVCFGANPPCPSQPQYYTLPAVLPIVQAGTDNWNLYTGGYFLGTTPDHLYNIYHSQFASTTCGGPANGFPQNYMFYCNPKYDSQAAAAEFSANLIDASALFATAAITAHQTGMTVPVFSNIARFAALNGWNLQPSTTSSLVTQLGHGLQAGFWSELNMKHKPNYTPSNSLFIPGGGDPSLIRRGFSQDTDNLSPFIATTFWDFEVINLVYDSMLQVNPLTGGTSQQFIDWMTTFHTSTFNPTEVSCVGPPALPRQVCVTGTTTQIWHLRNDIFFHDGTPVTATDVAYTIVAYRDVPSSNLQSNVITVASATALDSHTLQVKLQNQSPFYEINIGGLPILPKHLWAPYCGDPPTPSSQCANPHFDPMATGIFVGSGPWVCKNVITGAVGGTCTETASSAPGTQIVSTDGKILVTANPNYVRGPANLQGTSFEALSWADKGDQGVVNILSIADAALHFCSTLPVQCPAGSLGGDPYWANPQYMCSGDTSVDICAISTAAGFYGHGITAPYTPIAMTGIDPNVDPFNIDLTTAGGPVMYYEGGPRTTSGQLTIKTVAITGTPSPPNFTATLKTSAGTLVGTSTGTVGTTSSVVLLSFTGVNTGQYSLTITYTGSITLTYTVLLNLQ